MYTGIWILIIFIDNIVIYLQKMGKVKDLKLLWLLIAIRHVLGKSICAHLSAWRGKRTRSDQIALFLVNLEHFLLRA